jgi:hypothetical protein
VTKPLSEAIDATIAWLETNPTNRTVRTLKTPDGCYCALGYLVNAAGYPLSNNNTLNYAYYRLNPSGDQLVGLFLSEVWQMNDANNIPATIDALKELKCHLPPC